MWYEIIPPMLIIGLIPVLPQWATWYINEFTLGNPMRRDMRDIWDRHMFTRDSRIDGAPWRHRGLENVPDD
ncbi:NADH dehydrogenase [ubiquinone] 1 alpha subcomplex subunit 1 [Monomorium pharaonis]|uniref:NADH dehydrogenase [ubiquinone] 1 alpha subcomplex subunit 1 n=1 Tax=Monomorium pharaonis TaxID=307658 RepID=UPI00102E16F4|nr:NADH dehydrogenase [ubiquinone] 1 alpha subcomplex subunit 1 [Monomorium pharaonis]